MTLRHESTNNVHGIANTFMIGAQKAGTTYLAALLDQSPEVCVSDPKEPQFFTTHFAKGFEWYRGCFSNPDAPVRLDASTTYSFLRPAADLDHPDAPGLLAPVPERILSACPHAKFIYMLRDPVKRAASAHLHNLRSTSAAEGAHSLVQAIKDDPMLAIASRYADQIERYFEVVPPDRFLFVDFAKFTRDTEGVLADICAFLGVDAADIRLEQAEGAKHGAHRSTRFGRMVRAGMSAMPGMTKAVKAALPDTLKQSLIDPMIKVPTQITFHDQDAAADLFAEDRARVEALTGLKI